VYLDPAVVRGAVLLELINLAESFKVNYSVFLLNQVWIETFENLETVTFPRYTSSFRLSGLGSPAWTVPGKCGALCVCVRARARLVVVRVCLCEPARTRVPIGRPAGGPWPRSTMDGRWRNRSGHSAHRG
jgi:hypothetical protein